MEIGLLSFVHPVFLNESVIIRFRVQFGINLHEGIFQNEEIARTASASAI